MKNSPNAVVLVLSVLLALVVAYVIADKTLATGAVVAVASDEVPDTAVQESYQKGFSEGLTTAAIAVIQQTQNCNPTAITVQNFTRYIVDMACVVQQPTQ